MQNNTFNSNTIINELKSFDDNHNLDEYYEIRNVSKDAYYFRNNQNVEKTVNYIFVDDDIKILNSIENWLNNKQLPEYPTYRLCGLGHETRTNNKYWHNQDLNYKEYLKEESQFRLNITEYFKIDDKNNIDEIKCLTIKLLKLNKILNKYNLHLVIHELYDNGFKEICTDVHYMYHEKTQIYNYDGENNYQLNDIYFIKESVYNSLFSKYNIFVHKIEDNECFEFEVFLSEPVEYYISDSDSDN